MTGTIAFRLDGGRLAYLVDGDLHIPIDEIGKTRLKVMAMFHPNRAIPDVEYGGQRYIPLMWAQQLFSKKDWSNWQLIQHRAREMYQEATQVSIQG